MGRRLAGVVNGLAVSAYKLVGLVALGGILLGLLGYLGVQGLFLFDRSWVAPAIVSPTDPNVLQLNAQLAQHAAARERLVAERRELKVRLEDAERQIAAADRFLERFRVAARGDREAQRRQLRRLEAIRAEHERAGEEIAASNRAYSGMSRVRAEELRSASLIDRERYLTANQQLAELAKVNLGLEETRLQLDGQAETLAREVRGLSAILEGVGSEGATSRSYTASTLLLEQRYTETALQRARAVQARDAAKESLAALDGAILRYDGLLASIQSSSYLRALQRNLTVAFVPYENQQNVRPGTPLYGCTFRILWCRRVGKVTGVLEGEVTAKHPIRPLDLRGTMVEVDLEEGGWAREQLLHAGRPPLWI